jgi:predicted dehydrogenase
MYRIAIIGAGELGSRHLQGVMKMNIPVSVEVVDPFPASLERARLRAQEIPANPNILQTVYIPSVGQLSDKIDLCIVATSSDVRMQVLQELLSTKKVKYLVLEKILFRYLSEYATAEALLNKTNTPAWVNCSKRTVSVYRTIRESVTPGEKLVVTATGGNWGLACNGIHYLDTMAYLNGDTDFTVDTSHVEKIIDSKRKGFSEITGSLIARQQNGSVLFLHASEQGDADIIHTITSEKYRWQVNESQGTFSVAAASAGWVSEHSTFHMPYQSELSTGLCEEILLTGTSGLPDYDTSAKLHCSYISALLKVFYGSNVDDSAACPIT